MALKSFLNSFGVSIRADVLGSIEQTDVPETIAPQCHQVVCYRAVLPYSINIEDRSISKTSFDAVVLLPNGGPIAALDVTREALVENKVALTFEDGLLTKADYTDPSLVGAAVNLPINLLKAIVSIPSAIFRFTLATETDTAEIEAEKGKIDAQQALLESQTKLAEAQIKLREKEAELEEAKSQP